MTPFEQETIIRYDETGSPAEVYTASKRVANLLMKRSLSPYRTEKSSGEVTGWFFHIPKTAVILKPGGHMIRVGGARKITATVPGVVVDATAEEA